jgi:hypothetical protein
VGCMLEIILLLQVFLWLHIFHQLFALPTFPTSFDVNTSLKSIPGMPHVRKLERHGISFSLFRKKFPWCHRSIQACLISLDRARMKFVVRSHSDPSPAPLLRCHYLV